MSASNAIAATPASSRITSFRAAAGERWRALAQRERRAVIGASLVLGLTLLWLVALQPALRSLRVAPAQIETLDGELQIMRALASETSSLRGATPVSRNQAVAALEAATQGLGPTAKLSLQGDRATLTFSNADAVMLRQWLELGRSAARVRPLELQMSRGANAYSGSLTVSLGASK